MLIANKMSNKVLVNEVMTLSYRWIRWCRVR